MSLSIDDCDDTVEEGEDEDVGTLRAPKVRKINYIPDKCFLCDKNYNPKKMIALSGANKQKHREVASSLKELNDQSAVVADNSKLCEFCLKRVLEVISGCFVCGQAITNARLIKPISDGRFKSLAIEERVSFQGSDSKREPNSSDRSCLSCQTRINSVIQEEASGNSVKMKVVLQRSKKSCIVCLGTRGLQDLPRNARINVFIQTGLFIIKGSKTCPQHLNGQNLITSLCEGLIAIDRQILIDPSEVSHWFKALRTEILRPVKQRYNDISSFEDSDLVALTSLTKLNFDDLYSYIESYRHTDRSKCHKVDLLCFLAKMRQGLSDDFLKAMIGYSTRQSVSAAVNRVRHALVDRFVPNFLGLGSISREELIDKHVPEYAQVLYNTTPEKKAIIILDGTYIYIPKSTNYRVLRQSFCMHKGAHLVKPIMVVAPDGWILDVHGPYFSDVKNNDAECLRDAMKDADGLKEYLEPLDIMLVDKGYDRVVQHLKEDHNLSVFMPKLLAKNKKQYTTEEANSTRIVTVSRWVVESRNGHLKSKFAMFRSMIPMQHVKHVGDFVRIACAIINAYSKPIQMKHATKEWAEDMLRQSKKQNKLRKFVEENKLQGQRKNWETLSAQSLPEFPQLTYEYLKKITFGVYQIKLARSYVQDKIQSEGHYNFRLHKDRPGLVRVQTKSRFSGSKHRNLWILYKDPLLTFNEDLYDKEDEGPILGWCCDCPNGARSLGCCAHVVSVLWYLGLARHKANAFPSNELLSAIKDSPQRPLPGAHINIVPEAINDEQNEEVHPEVIEVTIENGQYYFNDFESEELDILDSFIFTRDEVTEPVEEETLEEAEETENEHSESDS